MYQKKEQREGGRAKGNMQETGDGRNGNGLVRTIAVVTVEDKCTRHRRATRVSQHTATAELRGLLPRCKGKGHSVCTAITAPGHDSQDYISGI